ncbi:hypothetical protein EVAR_40768_1 [Eumeta japonica]|uniref:Uncharacterized protein n=1 Tax=Eumeta variegata TaxID=151549 RepID=A0A4C1X457_EUMVA|nr:hypothetical protein EVAR_40768_1 [Eumeta japonica]
MFLNLVLHVLNFRVQTDITRPGALRRYLIIYLKHFARVSPKLKTGSVQKLSSFIPEPKCIEIYSWKRDPPAPGHLARCSSPNVQLIISDALFQSHPNAASACSRAS